MTLTLAFIILLKKVYQVTKLDREEYSFSVQKFEIFENISKVHCKCVYTHNTS